MKNTIMALLALGGLVLAMQVSQAVADPEKTITGDGACAKCILKEATECQLTITTEAGGKKAVYYLAQNSVAKEFGNRLCAEKKRITATGTVKTVDGKQVLTPAKIELAKE